MTKRAPPSHLRVVSVQSRQRMEAGMRQDERHHTSDDIFVGIDLATRQHQVVVVDAQGQRLTSFKVPHFREGLHELVERCTSRRVCRDRGRVRFAFEATGHVWEAVGAFFEQQGLRYQVVNPLATFRVREARQMGTRQTRPHRRRGDRPAAPHGGRHPVPAPPRSVHAAAAGLGRVPSSSPRARTTRSCGRRGRTIVT